MPRLALPPRQTPVTAGKIDCPRCGMKRLDQLTLRCMCSAEFTAAGLAEFQARPAHLARRL